MFSLTFMDMHVSYVLVPWTEYTWAEDRYAGYEKLDGFAARSIIERVVLGRWTSDLQRLAAEMSGPPCAVRLLPDARQACECVLRELDGLLPRLVLLRRAAPQPTTIAALAEMEAGAQPEAVKSTLDWVAIELLDETDSPVPFRRFELTLPNGVVHTGTPGRQGARARHGHRSGGLQGEISGARQG